MRVVWEKKGGGAKFSESLVIFSINVIKEKIITTQNLYLLFELNSSLTHAHMLKMSIYSTLMFGGK